MHPDETRIESIGESQDLPFILHFMEERLGATHVTTTGTYDNPDGADQE